MHTLVPEQSDDRAMMRLAIEEARKAASNGEVPVGAVLVGPDGRAIEKSGNNIIKAHDPTGHAEIRVLRKAGKRLKNYRFPDTTLFVTLEPCAMCATALVHARISRVVFGAEDPKTGAIVSQYTIGGDGKLNHTFTVTTGVLGEECSLLLTDFFTMRRAEKRKRKHT